MGESLPAASAGQKARDGTGAGAGAAGERDAAAAFPCSHGKFGMVLNLNKMSVYPLGKKLWFSISGPMVSSGIDRTSLTKNTACGLPIDTQVIS